MNKKQTIMLAMAGVALAAASQAQAQLNPVYANGDLLLNFRNAASGSTAPNVEVDLGSITTFAGLTGTTVLDTVANNGYTPVAGFSEANLATTLGLPGTSSPTGFSAAAANGSAGAYTLFLTASMATPTLSPTDPGIQQGNTAQTAVRNLINLVGGGASGLDGTPTSDITTLGARTVGVASTDANSYYNKAKDGTGTVDYNGGESATLGIESLQNGSGNIYEALWKAPTTGHGSDSFLGYFTFMPNDEVDFTSVNPSVVPEPATYGLLAGLGLLGLALRRQFRAQTA